MSLEDFTLVRLGALAKGNYKVSFKEEKRKKNILVLGNCRVSFLPEDWLIISSREGGFLTQQMEVRWPDH